MKPHFESEQQDMETQLSKLEQSILAIKQFELKQEWDKTRSVDGPAVQSFYKDRIKGMKDLQVPLDYTELHAEANTYTQQAQVQLTPIKALVTVFNIFLLIAVAILYVLDLIKRIWVGSFVLRVCVIGIVLVALLGVGYTLLRVPLHLP